MSQEQVYFVTISGSPAGRSSAFFLTGKNADDICIKQNERAQALSIKTKYSVVSIDKAAVPAGEKIRS